MLDAACSAGKLGATSYAAQGHGDVVVLIHGVGLAKEAWNSLAKALARNYRVVAYDMLGHGSSDLPPEHVELRAYAQQFIDLLDGLGIESANVVGHSMGALVALETALAFPDRVKRVAALNSVFERTEEQRSAVRARAASLRECGIRQSVKPTIARWFGDPVPEVLRQVADDIERLLEQADPVGYARTYELFASSDRAHSDRLGEMQVPALFMTAEFDGNSMPSMSLAMAALAPHAKAVMVPGARHMMTVTHSQKVLEELEYFLDQEV
mgnify:CR=1 FL=1